MTNPHISKDDLPEFRFSKHAREVMARRNISEVDVARVLVYGSSHPHNGLHRYVRDNLTVVVDLDAKVIVTVLLFNDGKPWDDNDARNR